MAQGIQFYKEQYKSRMRKIVEISELAFAEADSARRLGNWHIAKPLSNDEMSRMERAAAADARANRRTTDRLVLHAHTDTGIAGDYDKLMQYI